MQDFSDEELHAVAELASATNEIEMQLCERGFDTASIERILMSIEPGDVDSDSGIAAGAIAAAQIAAAYADLPAPTPMTCEGPGRNCGAPIRVKCSRCLSRYYCSSHCQRADWKNGHREACRPSMSVSEGGASGASTASGL